MREQYQHTPLANRKIPGVENERKNDGLTNRYEPKNTKENAAAAGPRNGVETSEKKRLSASDHTSKRKPSAMAEFGHPDHKGAARMLGFALACRDFEGWRNFSDFSALALSEAERASLSWAALRSLDAGHAEAVASCILSATGAPLPTFLAPMDDARWWASVASRAELKAYALSAFEALPQSDQRAFIRHITEVEIAA